MAISSKVQALCKQYIDMIKQINSYKSFSSPETVKTASNYYSLGSRYRELYAIMAKLSMEGYIQMKQVEDLMNQYKTEYGYNSKSSN